MQIQKAKRVPVSRGGSPGVVSETGPCHNVTDPQAEHICSHLFPGDGLYVDVSADQRQP